MAAGNFAWDRVFSFSQLLCLFVEKYSTGIHISRSDQFWLLMYLCLLPSSATVKMNNGEKMENARYATNDDTAVFIDQAKNINTSRKTEHDLKLIKNYFASIGEIRNVDGIPTVELDLCLARFLLNVMTLLHHIPYQVMVSENDQLSQKTPWSIW